MRKIKFINYAILLCLIAYCMEGCKKENENSNNSNNNDEPENVITLADNLEGIYSVYPVNSTGPAWSVPLLNTIVYPDSLLRIEKISENEIKATGFFELIGHIVDESVCFDTLIYNSYSAPDAIHSIPESILRFDPASLEGNLLNFSYYYGERYASTIPYQMNGPWSLVAYKH